MMSKNLQRLLFGKFCSLFAASLFTFVAGLTVFMGNVIRASIRTCLTRRDTAADSVISRCRRSV